LTVGGTITGTLAVGSAVFAAGMQPYTRITAFGTGTGGAGTYTVNIYQTFASAAISGSATDSNTVIRITDTDTSQAAGQPTGGLQFYTSDTSTPTAGVGAYVAAVAESNTPDTALVFGTRDNSGGGVDASERMRIDSSGNVGIGTASPTAKVDNTGSFRTTGVTDPTSGTGLELSYRSTYGDVLAYNRTSSAFAELQIRGAPIIFGNAGGERMRIDSSGNVLIGTSTSPAGTKELVLGGDYIEGVVAIGNSGTSKTIDLANGTVQTVTMTGNCTFTMPTTIAGKSFVLIVSTGVGFFTGTFTSVKWPNNTAPPLTITASRWDIFTFFSDGTNWYGTSAQAFQ
jgi:hypothetical protein